MKLLALAVFIAGCPLSTLTYAQQNGPYGQNGPSKLELEGKLQAWQNGMMRIVNATGQPVLFALPQSENAIRFTAPVELAALQKGMMVRIQAPASPNGPFLEPIRSLTLFTPDPTKLKTPMDRSMNFPGIYRMAELQRPVPGEMASPDVRVIGAIIGVEPSTLTLQCGNGPLKLELSETPSIELIASSLDLARPGDSVKAIVVGNPSTNQFNALSLSVEAAKPIAAPTPPTVTTQESFKLRVKEKAKSKLKAPLKKGTPASSEKTEMKDPKAPQEPTEKPELKSDKPETPETTVKKESP